jgi:DNA polymerase elongation subunit (family B)
MSEQTTEQTKTTSLTALKGKIVQKAHKVIDTIAQKERNIEAKINALLANKASLRESNEYREATAIIRSLDLGINARHSN